MGILRAINNGKFPIEGGANERERGEIRFIGEKRRNPWAFNLEKEKSPTTTTTRRERNKNRLVMILLFQRQLFSRIERTRHKAPLFRSIAHNSRLDVIYIEYPSICLSTIQSASAMYWLCNSISFRYCSSSSPFYVRFDFIAERCGAAWHDRRPMDLMDVCCSPIKLLE